LIEWNSIITLFRSSAMKLLCGEETRPGAT
jgi:hypothetical protein